MSRRLYRHLPLLKKQHNQPYCERFSSRKWRAKGIGIITINDLITPENRYLFQCDPVIKPKGIIVCQTCGIKRKM
jgi:hypothetical protein